jgi:hypothetical protein
MRLLNLVYASYMADHASVVDQVISADGHHMCLWTFNDYKIWL